MLLESHARPVRRCCLISSCLILLSCVFTHCVVPCLHKTILWKRPLVCDARCHDASTVVLEVLFVLGTLPSQQSPRAEKARAKEKRSSGIKVLIDV